MKANLLGLAHHTLELNSALVIGVLDFLQGLLGQGATLIKRAGPSEQQAAVMRIVAVCAPLCKLVKVLPGFADIVAIKAGQPATVEIRGAL